MSCSNGGHGSEFIRQETLHREKWLSLEKYTYRDPMGQERVWEVVERTTKSTINNSGDAVVMIGILKKALHHDCILLVKQFRPPLKTYCIEFPAGLIDINESVSEAAIREMKEETGYLGTIERISPATSLNAGICASTVHIVNMKIDGDDHVNKKPISKPDCGEFIELFVVPVNEMLSRLEKLALGGCVIDALVYTYAGVLDQQKHPDKHPDKLVKT